MSAPTCQAGRHGKYARCLSQRWKLLQNSLNCTIFGFEMVHEQPLLPLWICSTSLAFLEVADPVCPLVAGRSSLSGMVNCQTCPEPYPAYEVIVPFCNLQSFCTAFSGQWAMSKTNMGYFECLPGGSMTGGSCLSTNAGIKQTLSGQMHLLAADMGTATTWL